MPLMRGNVIGHDADRRMFKFTMLRPNAGTVSCQISSVAMDYLDGRRGTPTSEREAQFIRLRDPVEKVASDVFDNDSDTQSAMVRIFAKHLPNERGEKADN
jgi:hypothetical protein